mgnify:CR=1 FL=1
MTEVGGERVFVKTAADLGLELIYGIRAWPAVLAGSLVWSALMLGPDRVLTVVYSLGITVATLVGAAGIFRYWRLDLSRNAVHNLMVVYLFGAVAFAAVMIALVAPALTVTRHTSPWESLLLTLWLFPYLVLGIAAIHVLRVGSYLEGDLRVLHSSYASDVLIPLAGYFLLSPSEATIPLLRPWWVKAGSVFTDEELEELKDTVFGKCTNCRRCSMNCPMGVDYATFNRMARGTLVSVGIMPEGVAVVSKDQWEIGNQMGVLKED